MASGINTTGLESTIRNLMEQIERLNEVFNQLESEINNISNNISSETGFAIIQKCSQIQEQFPRVKKNISTYIDDIENVISSYINQDHELSQTITQNITKLEEGRE